MIGFDPFQKLTSFKDIEKKKKKTPHFFRQTAHIKSRIRSGLTGLADEMRSSSVTLRFNYNLLLNNGENDGRY